MTPWRRSHSEFICGQGWQQVLWNDPIVPVSQLRSKRAMSILIGTAMIDGERHDPAVS